MGNVCSKGINPTEEKQGEYAANDFTYSKFEEMTVGYLYTTRWNRDKYGRYELGDETTIWIDMSKQRECSYDRYNEDTKENDKIKLVPLVNNESLPLPVEYRGITLRQLLAVVANIRRRCITENWRNTNGVSLTPETVTLYDCNKYVILPFTESAKQSFVSCLPSTAGPQPPRWFASHWWGETVFDFIRCLEQHLHDFGVNGYRSWEDDGSVDDRRGGGMTMDTPIWICAYSNNQYQLEDDIPDDPKDSGFTRAMYVAEGRTISIVDRDGVVFKRIWCAYELYLTLVNKRLEDEGATKSKEGNWAIYTANGHKYKNRKTSKSEERNAVGMISGGAPIDDGWAYNTTIREEYFPFQLIKQSLTVTVETAEASKDIDRIHILNTIRMNGGDCINDPPPAIHPNYDKVNNAVRAGFISSVPSLKAATAEKDDVWDTFLLTMLKGEQELKMSFVFNDDGWNGLTPKRAMQLIQHLPLTTVVLFIGDASFGASFIDVVSEYVSKSSRLDYFGFGNISVGEEEGGRNASVRFVEAIGTNTSLTTLYLHSTDMLVLNNLEQWGSALMKNKTITKLVVRAVKDEDEIRNKLEELTKHRTSKLNIIC